MHTIRSDFKTESAALVAGVIDTFLVERVEQASKVSPYYEELWVEIQRLMHSGGKRLRSRIVLLSYCLFNGEEMARVAPAAAAQELLHLAMLIHDDIIDRDYVRYGVDNIAGSYLKKYRALVEDESDRLHFSHSASVLAGDLLLSEAYILMTQADVAPEKIIAIQRLLGTGVFEVVGGELLDTELVFRGAGEVSPETVALYKTSSYTFTLPFMVGAELAGASDQDKEGLRLFCRHLGIAFQLRDDVIGVFGNERETGKSATGDIREGKRTYMVERFYEAATESQRDEFGAYFGNASITEDEAEIVRELLQASGALEKTESEIDRREAAARSALQSVTMQTVYLPELDSLIAAATKRVK